MKLDFSILVHLVSCNTLFTPDVSEFIFKLLNMPERDILKATIFKVMKEFFRIEMIMGIGHELGVC